MVSRPEGGLQVRHFYRQNHATGMPPPVILKLFKYFISSLTGLYGGYFFYENRLTISARPRHQIAQTCNRKAAQGLKNRQYTGIRPPGTADALSFTSEGAHTDLNGIN
jgi:hypothetical protein